MVVAIHQPNYLPWLGYFYKIWASEVFVFHDNIEFSKGNYHQRVYIRSSYTSMEKKFISVSLKRHSDFVLFKDLELNQDHDWQTKHLNILKNTYRQAPFFGTYFPEIEAILMNSRNEIYFSKFCIHLVKHILGLLAIERPFYISSNLPILPLKADYYNAAIVKYLDGSVYLSGIGGRLYQKETT